MGVLRKPGRKTFLKLPNGKDVYVPNISSSNHFEYRVCGIRVKTLRDLKRALDGGLRVEMWSKYNGEVDYKAQLNHETGNWDTID